MAFYRLLEESGCSLADRDQQYQTPRDVAMQAGLMENVAAIDKWVMNLAITGKSLLSSLSLLSLLLLLFVHSLHLLFHPPLRLFFTVLSFCFLYISFLSLCDL